MTKKTEIEHLKEQLAEKEKLIEEQKNKFLRALADLDNYKKRAALAKDELIKYSNELLVKELLPAIDGFARALEFAKKADNEDLVKGISLIKKQVEDALAKFGVREIEAAGKPYDPHFHEAILMKESEKEPGIILEEMQKGYTLHERLLRPSMVIVSKLKEGKK
ncbi:MAG: nucleotide exchange factor GrpE [bacterium]